MQTHSGKSRAPMPYGPVFLYCISYIFVSASGQVITCSLPMLETDYAFAGRWTTTDAGMLLGYASFAAGLGFGAWGVLIDMIGNRWGALIGAGISLWGTAAGALLFSVAESKTTLTVGAVLLRLSYSAGMPWEIKAMTLTVPAEHQAFAISVNGLGSRTGSIAARCLFGVLLDNFSWRFLARMMCICLFTMGVFTMICISPRLEAASQALDPSLPGPGRDCKAKPRAKSSSTLARLARLGAEPAVWLVAAGFAFFCQIIHGDDLMPLLFFGLSNSPRSVTSSAIFPVGGICAMLLNSALSHRLGTKTQRHWFYLKLSLATFGSFSLLWLLACVSLPLPLWLVMLLAYIAGLSASPAYYQLANTFAMEYGGEDCSTLVGIYESISFVSKSPVHMRILRVADVQGWGAAVQLLVGVSLAAVASMYLFVLRWHRLMNMARDKNSWAMEYKK